jgi:tetratricopeptide (TPR) repeat protein
VHLSRLWLVVFCFAAAVQAAPYTPASDTEVVEQLPLRRSDPEAAELQRLRASWRANPRDVNAAVALAQHYFERTAAEGDPRYVGYAQAALGPWWEQPAPPPAVRLLRAQLKQFGHDFAAAVADLQAVVQAEPANAQAWAWLAAIGMVQARYDDVRQACMGFAGADAAGEAALARATCLASVDSLTGRAALAAQAIREALARTPEASPPLKLWVLTRLGEIEERRGLYPAAEAAFKQALALGLQDTYLQCAYADFLLDRGRTTEVLALLKDQSRADTLLLRLALAAKAASDARAAAYARDLGARFDAARRRGDATHEKEEARFALGVLGDAPRALQLAAHNFQIQKEPADARALLEAALAARQPQAAQPVLQWMQGAGVESVALQRLAQALKDLR